MNVGKTLGAGMQKLTVRFLLKGPGSSVLVAGTLALAGLGAATLTQSADMSNPPHAAISTSATLPSAYGCFNDPDGDGTIKCPSSVAISTLPSAWGQCQANLYGDGLIVCEGTNR